MMSQEKDTVLTPEGGSAPERNCAVVLSEMEDFAEFCQDIYEICESSGDTEVYILPISEYNKMCAEREKLLQCCRNAANACTALTRYVEALEAKIAVRQADDAMRCLKLGR